MTLHISSSLLKLYFFFEDLRAGHKLLSKMHEVVRFQHCNLDINNLRRMKDVC